jgi:hypothetical protein
MCAQRPWPPHTWFSEGWARIAADRRQEAEQAREYGLELRERRLDIREDVLLRRAAVLEEVERRLNPPA